MIYNVLEVKERWELTTLYIIPLLAALIYIYKEKRSASCRVKKRPLLFFIFAWFIGISSLRHTTIIANNELHSLKSAFENRNYLSASGKIEIKKNQGDGLDRFQIDKQSFIRIDPNKQVPMHGCWRKYISHMRSLNGKSVKMNYIIYHDWATLPLKKDGVRADQICILSLEIVD